MVKRATYSTRFAVMLQHKLHVFCCPFFGTFNRGLTMVSCKTTAEEVLFAWSRKWSWDAIIVDSVSVVLVFTLSLNECIVTALFRFQVHLPGIKWMESHKGVFNVAVRAVSSVHNQVRRMFLNLLIPAFVFKNFQRKGLFLQLGELVLY